MGCICSYFLCIVEEMRICFFSKICKEYTFITKMFLIFYQQDLVNQAFRKVVGYKQAVIHGFSTCTKSAYCYCVDFE